MMESLDPLVPGEVDLRDMPIPLDVLVELAMREFGMSREDAETIIREIAECREMKISEVGHG